MGTMAHSLEFDDTRNESIAQISVPLVSAALAVGVQMGTSGQELIRATAQAPRKANRMSREAKRQRPSSSTNSSWYSPTAKGVSACAAGVSPGLAIDREVADSAGMRGVSHVDQNVGDGVAHGDSTVARGEEGPDLLAPLERRDARLQPAAFAGEHLHQRLVFEVIHAAAVAVDEVAAGGLNGRVIAARLS